MGDEVEFGELSEVGGPHYGGMRWDGRPVNSPQHHHLHATNSASATSRYAQRPQGSYEAEDVMARGGSNSRGRSGLYYSPPGTSYTIVERPTTAPSSQHSLHHPGASKHPRGTYLGSSATFNNNRTHPTMSNGKKRPISPEQVLKLMGAGGGAPKMTGGRRSAVSSPASSPASHLHHQNVQEDLLVRTVNMVRPADSPQGFGICVKGGKDSDNSVYISRVEVDSVAERVGLRAGDTILEVNGTPFKGITHEEALKMLKSNRVLSMTVKSPNLTPHELQPPDRGPPGGGSAPWVVRQTYSWMDRQGRPVSPPPEYARATPPVIVAPPPMPPMPRYYRPKDKGTRKVELSIDPGQSLGLMIRGGVEYNLGIFITGVDKDSVADRAGLMIGDQILEVNGQSFLDVSHDDAVNQLKFYKRMTLTVRDVGKVPHSCTAYDDILAWESATAHSPGHMGMHKTRSPALMMVEEKARILLKKSEFSTLAYYQEEYAARQMTIEAFVAVLLELLNTHEKYTLLTELREVVLPEDRSRFDELVYRREVEGQRCREFRDMLDQREHEKHDKQGMASSRRGGVNAQGGEPNHALLMSNLHDLPGPPEYRATSRPCQFPVVVDAGNVYLPFNETEEFRTPSEDSGVGMSLELANTRVHSNSSRGGYEGSFPGQWAGSPSSQLQRSTDLALANNADGPQDYGSWEGDVRRGRRHSSPDESRRTSLIAMDHEPSRYNQDANMCGYLEGLRSHLGGWTQKVKSWYWGRPLELGHKMSRSFDMKENQEMLESDGSAMRRHQSMQRLSRGDLADSALDEELAALVVPDQEGNLRITVKKTKPILGIAIEGGANTKHALPRIINIHDNGAAFDAGGLEVGQLILEVDGQKVEGMHHQDVARLIAESFARRDRHDIEFLVIEAKKSNLEPKPTALIFLEA